MTTMVRYDGRIVGFVGREHAYLAPEVEALPDGHRTLRIAALMCDFALRAAQEEPPLPYSDAAALEYARARLAIE
jgi:hypothetical protein